MTLNFHFPGQLELGVQCTHRLSGDKDSLFVALRNNFSDTESRHRNMPKGGSPGGDREWGGLQGKARPGGEELGLRRGCEVMRNSMEAQGEEWNESTVGASDLHRGDT